MHCMVRLSTIGLLFILWSCHSPDADKIGGQTLNVHVYHHAEVVPFITVYLMESAEDFPGDELSDYHFSTHSNAEGIATFNHLLSGYHWIYGYGLEGTDTVKGNGPVFINPTDEDGQSKVILNVSEKH